MFLVPRGAETIVFMGIDVLFKVALATVRRDLIVRHYATTFDQDCCDIIVSFTEAGQRVLVRRQVRFFFFDFIFAFSKG